MSEFLFQDEPEQEEDIPKKSSNKTWKILVVDDDESVHQVTNLVLSTTEVEGKKLEIVSVFSSKEAKQKLQKVNAILIIFFLQFFGQFQF